MSTTAFNWPIARRLAALAQQAYSEATIIDADTDTQVLVTLDSQGDILIAFRGSSSARDFVTDCKVNMSRMTEVEQWSSDAPAAIHDGFLDAFVSVAPDVIRLVRDMLADHPLAKVYITGHSLGGALAILCAREFERLHLPVALVVTFGQPRVGNATFAQIYDAALRDLTFRVVNQNDIVPRLPGVLMGYRHCGQEVFMQPVAGWGFNPGFWAKLLFDAAGLYGAYRRLDDVLFKNHYMGSYQERMKTIA